MTTAPTKISNELRARLITGFSLAGLLIFLLIASYWNIWVKWGLLLLSFVASVMGVFEFASMGMLSPSVLESERKTYRSMLTIGLVTPLLVLFGVLSRQCVFVDELSDFSGRLSALYVSAIVIGIVIIAFTCVAQGRNNVEICKAMIRDALACYAFVIVGGLALMIISVLPSAGVSLFWFLLVICLNDVGAYFSGKHFGGPKLAPEISPNKTVSGSIGGLLVGLLAGCSSYFLIPHVTSMLDAALLVLALVLTAQVGDLMISCVKRFYGVKNSGFVFPGHGGVLDRMDGIFFSAPVFLSWIFWGAI